MNVNVVAVVVVVVVVVVVHALVQRLSIHH